MKSKAKRIRNIILVVLMAVLCIGVTELSFCRAADPELYETITAPAVAAWHGFRADAAAAAQAFGRGARAVWAGAVQGVRNTRQRLADAAAERRAEKLRREAEAAAAAEEPQVAGDPSIREYFIPADPTITEFLFEDGTEILTGGNERIVYFNQSDEQWAEELFGTDPIGRYGCGPTALAMAVSSLCEGIAVTPAELAAWAAGEGYAARRSGSRLSIVDGTAAYYGLSCTPLEVMDGDALYDALSEGGLIVALMGPGHFTSSGHFILLHGVTLAGEILVADPHSRDNSLVAWDPQLVIDELSRSRSDGAPLWILSSPLTL